MHALTRRRFVGRVAAVAGGLSATSSPSPAGQPATYDGTALRRLRETLRGGLVVPGDPSYDADRRVFYWNPRTETRPAVIVRCAHEDDARRAVEFARRHGLQIAVRSGGHSHLAWGGSHGVVIDLAPLRRITIDPERRLVRAEAGVLSGEVAVAAGRHGLVPVLGQCPGVGATGVTLGGGLGWLSGLFGACCGGARPLHLPLPCRVGRAGRAVAALPAGDRATHPRGDPRAAVRHPGHEGGGHCSGRHAAEHLPSDRGRVSGVGQ